MPIFFNWLLQLQAFLKPMAVGVSVTVATAKLTPAGANGSITYQNGVVTAQTPAT